MASNETELLNQMADELELDDSLKAQIIRKENEMPSIMSASEARGDAARSPKEASELERLTYQIQAIHGDAEGIYHRVSSIADDVFGSSAPANVTNLDKTSGESIKSPKIYNLGMNVERLEKLIQRIHTEINRLEKL